MHKLTIILLLLTCGVVPAFSQNQEVAAEREVEITSNVSYYFLPDEDNLISPVIGLLWNDIYFEGRYNYESRDTGSMWVGVPFSFGDTLSFEFTPMIGAIFGEIDGAAPGFELDSSWRSFNYYLESEYVFDFDSREENFFYAWSELTYALCESFKIGIAASRTRAYSSSVDINRGPMVVFEKGSVSFTAAVLNIDSKALTMLSAEVGF